jgi:hypothetical protein
MSLRAHRRVRRQIFGPSPREALGFFTPALIALLLAGILLRIFVALQLPGASAEYSLATGRGLGCLRTQLLILPILLIGYYTISHLGWLAEVRNQGWDAYRNWRIVGGLWAVFVVALSIPLFVRALGLPSAADLVREADAELQEGSADALAACLAHDLDGAEKLCDALTRDPDPSCRFLGAAFLASRAGARDGLPGIIEDSASLLRSRIQAGELPERMDPAVLQRYRDGLTILDQGRYLSAPALPGEFREGGSFWDRWDRVAKDLAR